MSLNHPSYRPYPSQPPSPSPSPSPSAPTPPPPPFITPSNDHHHLLTISNSSASSLSASPSSISNHHSKLSYAPTHHQQLHHHPSQQNLKPIRSAPSHHHPPSVLLATFDSSTAWLIYYFLFNLGLTIFNKRVLISFPFPWTLTAIHTLAGTIGSQLARTHRIFTPARLSRNHNIILIAFSILYTVNIAVSNLSLHLVTVPFHQVVRATTPLFTIILSIIYFNKTYPIETYVSLMIVVLGVGLSTYGDYGWTKTGLLLTLLGTVLASIKTIVTNVIQVGRLRLNPLDLLMRMSPLAFLQCIIYAYLTGEIDRLNRFSENHLLDRQKIFSLTINGLIAFGLNVVSFTANKKTSALTMTVAANVKQVLTILTAIIIFKLVISPMNLLGILITLIGGAYYAKIELERKYASKVIKDVLIIPNQHDHNQNNDQDHHHHHVHNHHYYHQVGQGLKHEQPHGPEARYSRLVKLSQDPSPIDRLNHPSHHHHLDLAEKSDQISFSGPIIQHNNHNHKRTFNHFTLDAPTSTPTPHSNHSSFNSPSIRELEEGLPLGDHDLSVLQTITPR